MKNILIILSLICCCFNLRAQKKEELYLNLVKRTYSKNISIRPIKIKTSKIDTAYSFFLPCKCEAGILNFFHGNNPETGRVNLPVRTASNQELKKINFISLIDLIQIMKANDNFNAKYNLFLVEENHLYHVFSLISFGDYTHDVIEP